jgi:hypothetical protein
VTVPTEVYGLHVPKPPTLKRYGLDFSAWFKHAQRQNFVCAACGLLPSSGRLCIDHEHVKRWRKMKPEMRSRYVRGLLCWFCNKNYVGRSITLAKARNVVRYLLAYKDRRDREEMAT